MSGARADAAERDPELEFYRIVLRLLARRRLPAMVGGAYAFRHYTGIARDTKDLDVFCRPTDVPRVLRALEREGFRTEVTFPHWLAKAYSGGERFVDVIFGSGNGVCHVDDRWFLHAPWANVLGVPVRLMPAEEMVWQKAFIMERERYDGADVAHLLRARAEAFDWDRLLERFDGHWRILLSHLVLFGFTYPSDRDRVPRRVTLELLRRLLEEQADGAQARLCRGTLLSRAQYLPDVDAWGYEDARLKPGGTMTARQVRHWTAPVDEKDRPASATRRRAVRKN